MFQNASFDPLWYASALPQTLVYGTPCVGKLTEVQPALECELVHLRVELTTV